MAAGTVITIEIFFLFKMAKLFDGSKHSFSGFLDLDSLHLHVSQQQCRTDNC